MLALAGKLSDVHNFVQNSSCTYSASLNEEQFSLSTHLWLVIGI